MGCLSSKMDADTPTARPHAPQCAQGFPSAAWQPGLRSSAASYGPGVAQGYPPQQGNQVMQQAHAQPQHQQMQQQQQPQSIPDTPFMRTAAPNGMPWSQYVQKGKLSIDHSTGYLTGPWAECICQCVRFEHSNAWQRMPEYTDGEGPVGGVLSALAAVAVDRTDAERLLEAANALEDAAHSAVEGGRPLPVASSPEAHASDDRYGGGRQPYDQPSGYEQPGSGQPYGQPAYGQPSYGQLDRQQPGYDQPAFGQQTGYGQPAYGQQTCHGQPAHEQQPGYGQPAHGQQPGYYGGSGDDYYQQQQQHQQQQQQYQDTGNPTLLGQQRPQKQGGGGGMGKLAMAAGGGLAAGAGGMFLASHLDDVGDAVGGAAGFVGDGVEDVGGFIGDGFGEVEDFFEGDE